MCKIHKERKGKIEKLLVPVLYPGYAALPVQAHSRLVDAAI